VRKGDVIGLVGNSRNSDAPHLHFHVCDAGSFVAAEELPIVFKTLEVQGRVTQTDDELFRGARWAPATAATGQVARRLAFRLRNLVLRFPTSAGIAPRS
jgi:hypothetical protein